MTLVVIRSANGSEIMTLTRGETDSYDPNWLPDETTNRLLFASSRGGNEDIYALDPVSGDGLRQITTGDSNEWQPAWSPDGARIAFVSDRENEGEFNIYAMQSDGSDIERLTPLGQQRQRASMAVSALDGAGPGFGAAAREPFQ